MPRREIFYLMILITTLTQHNQLNQVLAQMKDHEHMFTTMAEAIRRASPNVDAFLDALVDAAFFAETDYLKQMQVLFDLRDFLNNHPPSNLATDLTPIQNLFNKDENKPTILNHIEPLLANNAALNAIEEITQKLPFITDIQQKKVALTFAMVPYLAPSINP